jgi:molybdopterin molybdotransferase
MRKEFGTMATIIEQSSSRMPNQLTPLAEALLHLLSHARPTSKSFRLPLAECLGQVLAEEIIANMAVPAYDNSAMDGYAICTGDCVAAGTVLAVSQTIAAGHPGVALVRGTAARIFTGAPVPNGADAVVMQENCRREGSNVVILQLPRQRENIRLAGHDIGKGSLVLAAGRRLQPQDLGLLASLGYTEVSVWQPLTVALLNTGDEVIAQGQPLQPGQLYDSNSFTLAGLLQQLGMRVIKLGIVADSLQATVQALQRAAQQADCVITTGGVSVGDADHVKQAVEQLGSISLWKLAIKPGKPFSFGQVGTTPFFGLPGNPVAVFITFVTLVQPFLLASQGAVAAPQPLLQVRAGFTVTESSARQEYLRVRLQQSAEGSPMATLYPDQSSSVLTSLSWADGLAVVPINTTVQPGQWLEYLSFRGVL